MAKYSIVRIGRDAESGEFISVEEARRHPRTTVVETVRRPVKK